MEEKTYGNVFILKLPRDSSKQYQEKTFQKCQKSGECSIYLFLWSVTDRADIWLWLWNLSCVKIKIIHNSLRVNPQTNRDVHRTSRELQIVAISKCWQKFVVHFVLFLPYRLLGQPSVSSCITFHAAVNFLFDFHTTLCASA